MERRRWQWWMCCCCYSPIEPGNLWDFPRSPRIAPSHSSSFRNTPLIWNTDFCLSWLFCWSRWLTISFLVIFFLGKKNIFFSPDSYICLQCISCFLILLQSSFFVALWLMSIPPPPTSWITTPFIYSTALLLPELLHSLFRRQRTLWRHWTLRREWCK